MDTQQTGGGRLPEEGRQRTMRGGRRLLLGGLRYHEQGYNLRGVNSYLSVIVERSGGMSALCFTLTSKYPRLW